MRRLLAAASNRPSLSVPAAIFCLALIPRLLWVYSADTNAFYRAIERSPPTDYAAPLGMGDLTFYLLTARSIADGNGYVEPFHTTPTARYPPGWPAVLSIFYRLFGTNALPAVTFNALVGAASCVLTYLLGTRLFSRSVGISAALIMAFFPGHVLFSAVLLTEVLFTFLVSCALLAALGGASHRSALAAGLIVGAAAAVRGEALFLPLGLGLVLLARGIRWRAALRYALLQAAVAVAIIVPWAVRSTVQLDAPVFLTTETGVNLMLGRMPQGSAGPDFMAYFAVAEPYRTEREPQRQLDIERASYRKTRERVRTHPLSELTLIPPKLRHLFEHDPVWGSAELIVAGLRRGPVTLLAMRRASEAYYFFVLTGCILLVPLRLRSRGLAVILAMAGLWSFVFGVVFFGIDRYHLPLLPLFAIGAAAGWGGLLALARQRARRRPLWRIRA